MFFWGPAFTTPVYRQVDPTIELSFHLVKTYDHVQFCNMLSGDSQLKLFVEPTMLAMTGRFS